MCALQLLLNLRNQNQSKPEGHITESDLQFVEHMAPEIITLEMVFLADKTLCVSSNSVKFTVKKQLGATMRHNSFKKQDEEK